MKEKKVRTKLAQNIHSNIRLGKQISHPAIVKHHPESMKLHTKRQIYKILKRHDKAVKANHNSSPQNFL